MISLALTAGCSYCWETAGGQTKNPLLFPKNNFTEETKTVKTTAGEKKVTYRSYMHIPCFLNTSLCWDAGHGADHDAEDFIAWIGNITGYRKNN